MSNDQSGTNCDCLVCAFRALLQERYPDGPTSEQKTEIRMKLAGIVGVMMSDASPQETMAFNREMQRRRDASAAADRFEDKLEEALNRIFGDSVMVIRV